MYIRYNDNQIYRNRASFYIKIPFTSIITYISIIYLAVFIASQISVKKINKISIIEAIRNLDNTKIEKIK